MKDRTLVVFIVAVALSLVAAHHRFGDSAHSMGMIRSDGGSARHPVVFDPGFDRYTLVATATVVPPYRGDVRVAVEGLPELTSRIYNNDPAVDLSPHHRPGFSGDTLYDVQPRDRIALWVVLEPRAQRQSAAGHTTHQAGGQDATCCAAEPATSDAKPAAAGPQLAFYDRASGRKLLGMPIRFRAEGDDDAHTH